MQNLHIECAIVHCSAVHWLLAIEKPVVCDMLGVLPLRCVAFAGKEAAMGPLRELQPAQLARVNARDLRPLGVNDFAAALGVIKPSVNREMLAVYDQFTKEFGTAC